MRRRIYLDSFLFIFLLAFQFQSHDGEYINVDSEPVLLKVVEPIYPPRALEEKREGEVVVTILVKTDGQVEAVRVVKSSSLDEIFNDAAIEAAKQWVFRPAIYKTKPIKFWYNIPMVFKLVKKDTLIAIIEPKVVILKDYSSSIFGEPVLVDEGPVLLQRIKPKYPLIARKNKIPGRVVLALLVDSNGRVEKHIVFESSNEVFNNNAITAAKQYFFKPAIYNGKPTKCWHIDSIIFRVK